MALWNNPFYKMESHGRGPRGWTDARGWLVGRSRMLVFWRLLTPAAIVGSVAIARAPWSNGQVQAMGQLALWLAPVVVSALVVLLGAAAATGRDWQQGRMEEWRVTPSDRPHLTAGKAWGWALPMAAALTAGAGVGAILWAASRFTGRGTPLLAPVEGILLVLEAWAALYLAAHLGVWAGHHARRAWPALALSLLLGTPLLAAITAGLFYTLDLARLGGHLMVIGGAWLLGSFFQGWSERKLR